MFKRIDHVALHVADLRRSVGFYEKHFGFSNYFQAPVPGGIEIAYLRLGDTVLELTEHSDGDMQGFHFCLETDNFAQAVSDLQRNGVAADACPKGHGLWLDAGELEEVTKRQGEGWLANLILGRR